MNEKWNQQKIAVVGLGGVGGYLAGMLGKTYPHVTAVARGNRLAALRSDGLTLHSEYKGEISARFEQVVTLQELPPQDYLFVCVKNYSLEEVCRDIAHAVTEHTVVIPIMNGVDPGDRMRRLLPRGKILDALIYIVAYANKDYSVTQEGAFARLQIGARNPDPALWQAAKDAAALLSCADIDCSAAEDIELAIWRKYILNCAYNVLTAYYDNTIGQLRDDPQKAKEYETLIREASQVALAKGVRLLPSHIQEIIDKFYHEYADNATSSLQRDLRAGKQAEIDTFSGYLVREAKRLGIPVPVSEKMYAGLTEKGIRM